MAARVIRGSLLLALGVACGVGCYQPVRVDPERAVKIWRELPRANLPDETRPSSPPRRLDAAQAAALALRINPQLNALRADVALERARVEEASQLDNPELRISQLRLDEMVADETEMSLALRFPIPRPGLIEARVDRAELEVAAASARVEDGERRLRARIKTLYARLTMLDMDAELIERAIALRKKHRELVAERVKASVGTRYDLAVASMPVAESLDDRQALGVERLAIENELRQLIGLGPADAVAFVLDREALGQVDERGLDADQLTESALAARPDVRERSARVGRAMAEAAAERTAQWPWFRFAQLSYEMLSNGGEPVLASDPDSVPRGSLSFGFAFSIELPLFTQNAGAIAAAEAKVAREKARERAAIELVAHQVRGQLGLVATTAARVKAMERSLLPELEKSAKTVSQAVEEGVIDPLRQTVVEQRIVRARREHLAALLAHREAVIALETAVGIPLGR